MAFFLNSGTEEIAWRLGEKQISFQVRGKNIKISLEENKIHLKQLKQNLLNAGFSFRKPTGNDNFILVFFSSSHIATIIEEETLLLHEPHVKQEIAAKLVGCLKQ